MRVNNAKLSFKIFFTIFTVYILSISIVVLIVMSSDLTGIMWQYVISDCCFLFILGSYKKIVNFSIISENFCIFPLKVKIK